ncbi:hypothetical protein M7I_1027 [Glarea lozoyensis 74030]|uniref:Uncharacterized protein n=1 Tax=Glarea lozoyensis (strain ATCC 74030 / MF5533) TaxID=1104152 RepID=H0EEZ0_GLAL7|nr:hypothetical protein M7I_1027 [Glarea lozoyensis 74030]
MLGVCDLSFWHAAFELIAISCGSQSRTISSTPCVISTDLEIRFKRVHIQDSYMKEVKLTGVWKVAEPNFL